MHTQFARSKGRIVSKSANLHQKCRFFCVYQKFFVPLQRFCEFRPIHDVKPDRREVSLRT